MQRIWWLTSTYWIFSCCFINRWFLSPLTMFVESSFEGCKNTVDYPNLFFLFVVGFPVLFFIFFFRLPYLTHLLGVKEKMVTAAMLYLFQGTKTILVCPRNVSRGLLTNDREYSSWNQPLKETYPECILRTQKTNEQRNIRSKVLDLQRNYWIMARSLAKSIILGNFDRIWRIGGYGG